MNTPAITPKFTNAVSIAIKALRELHQVTIATNMTDEIVEIKLYLDDMVSRHQEISDICKDIRHLLEAMSSDSPSADKHKWVQIDFASYTIWEYVSS